MQTDPQTKAIPSQALRTHGDYAIFIGVDSEADRFALGSEREHWDRQALAKLDVELGRFVEHYRPFVHEACRRLIFQLRG